MYNSCFFSHTLQTFGGLVIISVQGVGGVYLKKIH